MGRRGRRAAPPALRQRPRRAACRVAGPQLTQRRLLGRPVRRGSANEGLSRKESQQCGAGHRCPAGTCAEPMNRPRGHRRAQLTDAGDRNVTKPIAVDSVGEKTRAIVAHAGSRTQGGPRAGSVPFRQLPGRVRVRVRPGFGVLPGVCGSEAQAAERGFWGRVSVVCDVAAGDWQLVHATSVPGGWCCRRGRLAGGR